MRKPLPPNLPTIRKKSFEDSAAALEKLMGAKSLEKAMEVQTEYFRSSYEDFVAESAKIGELYADLAKEAYKPFESALAKTSDDEVTARYPLAAPPVLIVSRFDLSSVYSGCFALPS